MLQIWGLIVPETYFSFEKRLVNYGLLWTRYYQTEVKLDWMLRALLEWGNLQKCGHAFLVNMHEMKGMVFCHLDSFIP